MKRSLKSSVNSSLKSSKTVSATVAMGLMVVLSACGKNAATSGNTTIQSNPLAGPNAASLGGSSYNLASLTRGLADLFFGVQSAWAAVQSFKSLTVCNDTLIFLDQNGKQLTVNGAAAPAGGAGLLTFSPSSGAPMAIATVDVPAGSSISEVDVTFANKPIVCGGANYAVQFDPGTGPLQITQNSAFKFKFTSARAFDGSAQTINLLFGAIVNNWVSQGAALNNSNIQSLIVQGSAQ